MPSSSLPSNQTDVIQNEFDSFVVNENKLDIPNRGGNFYFTICAQIPSERHLYDSDIICTLAEDSTTDGFLQIFKASTNNIHNVQVTLSGSTVEDAAVDDFSSYSDTTDLCETYEYDGSWYFEPSLESEDGDKYLSAYLNRKGDGYRIWRDLSATPYNMSNYNGMTFDYQSGVVGSSNSMGLIISDGTNEAYMEFSSQYSWTWETREFTFSSFTNIGLVDTANITYIAIEATSVDSSTTVMFNNWVLTGGITSNTTGIKLYDFGSEPNPSILGTQIPQDYDNYRLEVELYPIKTVMSLGVSLGSEELDDTLEIGHYYGIYIEKPDIGTMNIYGSTTQQYLSGKAYTVSGTTLTETSSSLGFMVMSAITARLSSLAIVPDKDPGSSKAYVFVTNRATGATLFFSEITLGIDGSTMELKDTLPEYIYTDRETSLTIYYQDASDSKATYLLARPKYYYNTFLMNG